LIEEDVPALDVRPADEFAAAHVPRSINIALSGQFASWAGSLLGLKAKPVLIVGHRDMLEEARMRLARVGIEELTGHLQDGITGWKSAGFALARLPQMTVQDLSRRLGDPGLKIIDVRRAGEWEASHLENAQLWPLDRFREGFPPVDKAAEIAVHCKSGYRSTIACSLLMRDGYKNVANVSGGFDTWEAAHLPSMKAEAVGQ
jgi:rhodanese-related sulfurtransferase